jgi:hypothetical protein
VGINSLKSLTDEIVLTETGSNQAEILKRDINEKGGEKL